LNLLHPNSNLEPKSTSIFIKRKLSFEYSLAMITNLTFQVSEPKQVGVVMGNIELGFDSKIYV